MVLPLFVGPHNNKFGMRVRFAKVSKSSIAHSAASARPYVIHRSVRMRRIRDGVSGTRCSPRRVAVLQNAGASSPRSSPLLHWQHPLPRLEVALCVFLLDDRRICRSRNTWYGLDPTALDDSQPSLTLAAGRLAGHHSLV